ncbi:MAG: hypothetical protein AABW59_01220 [archaeon]
MKKRRNETMPAQNEIMPAHKLFAGLMRKVLIKPFFKALFGYKYPKLTLMMISIVFAYLTFSDPNMVNYLSHLNDLSYLGVLFGGLLFSFGFTSPFAAGIFLEISPQIYSLQPLLAGLGRPQETC